MFSLHGVRRSLALTVRGLGLRRCSSTSLPYVPEEGKINVSGERNPPDNGPSSFVHPSAIVHPNAILGQVADQQRLGLPKLPLNGAIKKFSLESLLMRLRENFDVSIGPFCTVGPLAKLGNSCQLYPGSHIFGNTDLGNNCILMSGAVVGDDLPGSTFIGCNNIIGHHALIGTKCQDMKYMPGSECFLEIGDNNEIREHTSIHRSSKPSDRTVIGDNNLIMGSCHIAHDCKVGNNNIFANNTLLAGHVVVEDYSHTAGAVVIHQFCRIGSFSFIGGGSVVSQDVPRYMMVSGERAELRGLNLEGLRRWGFSVTEIRSLRAAYRKIFMAIDTNSGSIEGRLDKVEQDEELGLVPAVCSMLKSIRESFAEDRRGICKFRCWRGT